MATLPSGALISMLLVLKARAKAAASVQGRPGRHRFESETHSDGAGRYADARGDLSQEAAVSLAESGWAATPAVMETPLPAFTRSRLVAGGDPFRHCGGRWYAAPAAMYVFALGQKMPMCSMPGRASKTISLPWLSRMIPFSCSRGA